MKRSWRGLVIAGACAAAVTSAAVAASADVTQADVTQAAVARAGSTAADVSRPDVIVVGTPGLRWSDVDAARTPTLWRLAGDSAIGSLSVKAADPVSCPDDGWLTLGAGNRARADDRAGRRCVGSRLAVHPQGLGGGAVVAGFVETYDDNQRRADDTRLGALGEALTAAGGCISAAGPPAALGAADSRGRVASYRSDAVAAAADAQFLRRCPVTLVAATPSNVDHLVALVAATAPPGSVLLIVGVAEPTAESAHLHAAFAHGPGFTGDALVSASTRRTPFVQLVDVAPTVLALRGERIPSSMIGQPWQVHTARPAHVTEKVAKLARLDLAAQRQGGAIVPFWVALVALMISTSSMALWAAHRRLPPGAGAAARAAPSDRIARFAALACTWCALLPAASFLAGIVSWWSSPKPLLVLGLATVLAATAATRIAVALEISVWRRRPFGLAAAVGVITFGVIALDLVTGAHLQMFTMAGYSPLVAGRFAGIGNVAFGIFAAGAVLAAAGLFEARHNSNRAQRTAARWNGWNRPGVLVATLGVAAVAVDGAPPWGSDVGGVLALVPGFAVLVWLLTGVRVSWRKAVGIGFTAIGIIALFAVVDYARPAAQQTHLGRFVGDVIHGGAWSIVRRKALADVRLLGYSVLTLLIPVMVAVAIWLVRRPPAVLRQTFARAAVLRPVLVALLVTVVVGAVLNDSGVVIPALAVVVALPATMAVVVASSRSGPAEPVGPAGDVIEPPASLLP